MKKKISLFSTVAAIFLFQNHANAQSITQNTTPSVHLGDASGGWLGPGKNGWFHNSSPWEVSARAGTLGIGPELSYHPKNSHFGFRADFDTYDFSVKNAGSSGVNFHINDALGMGAKVDGRLTSKYSGRAKLMNGSIYGDYYPWKKSAFRLTAGLIFNKNQITPNAHLSATGTASVQLLHRVGHYPLDFPDAGNLSGKGKWNFLSPYVGLGWNTEIAGGFYFNGDIGAMFQQNSHLSIHSGSDDLINQFPQTQRAVNSVEGKINHYMNKVAPAYPVIMIGFGYRF